MLELFALTALLFAAADAPPVAELDAAIEIPKTSYVLGEPIHVTGTVTNVSGRDLTIPRGGGRGLRVFFSVERSDGLIWRDCREILVRAKPRLFSEEVPPGWRETLVDTLDCLDDPGTYVIHLEVVSEGGYPEVDPQAASAWSGRAVSSPVEIRLTEPVDEDLEAFEVLRDPVAHRRELLERFPTSTYAGYALVHGRPWPLDPVAELELRRSRDSTANEEPAVRRQSERIEREQWQLSEERARLIANYLEARPDFVYADFMRLELATRLAYVERYDEARVLCEQLVTRRSVEAEKARALLNHLRVEGWLPR